MAPGALLVATTFFNRLSSLSENVYKYYYSNIEVKSQGAIPLTVKISPAM
jgi:hypothetical protein